MVCIGLEYLISHIYVNRANGSLALFPIFTQNLMFIRCSRSLPLIFPPTVYHGHVLLPLLLGNERLIWSVAHVNASGTCPNMLQYTSLPNSTPQRDAATIPGIKLSHHMFLRMNSRVSKRVGDIRNSKLYIN